MGAIVYSKISGGVLKQLFRLIIITLFIEFIARVLFERGMNNMFLFHLYTFVEFGFVSAIFYLLSRSEAWKKLILIVSSLFVVFSILNLLFFEGIEQFNSNQRYFECISVFVYCVGYYLGVLRSSESFFLEREPMFWLTSGYLLYFSGTLFLFLYTKSFMDVGKELRYWELHGILNIWLNVIYSFVLWLGTRKSIA